MAYIEGKDREQVLKALEELKDPVTIINFTQKFECQFCSETRELLEEFTGLSDKLSLEVYNLTLDQEKADEYGVDKIPATILTNGKNLGIRWFGVPLGYEFVTLLEDTIAVSQGESGLEQETKDALKEINTDVHIQVFVTPTCPYCPRAVSLAHRFAMESDFITADMVEATEFPHLAQKYNVRGVPRSIINETEALEGAAPEQMLLEKVLTVAGQSS